MIVVMMINWTVLGTYETWRARWRRWICVVRDNPRVGWATAPRHCASQLCHHPRVTFTRASQHEFSLKCGISYQSSNTSCDLWRHCVTSLFLTFTKLSQHKLSQIWNHHSLGSSDHPCNSQPRPRSKGKCFWSLPYTRYLKSNPRESFWDVSDWW